MRFHAVVFLVVLAVLAPLTGGAEERTSTAWITAVRIIKIGSPSGSGIYLWSSLIITAAHLTSADAKMGVHIAGKALPATVLK